MKVKFSVIPFIPAVFAMIFFRVMSIYGMDESGNFLGMDRMALSYTTIGIALGLFVLCILFNIFDRKTAPVYPVKKNFLAGIFAILSGLVIIASSCMSLVEITTNSEYFMMGVISAVFSLPAGLAFIIMSRVHFTGKSTVSGVSFLYVFPALWGCTELVFEFLNATKVSISATDLTGLFCYIFITLYYFSHSMVVSRIKGRNPVKSCFIYGLPAIALLFSHGVYLIITTMNEQVSSIPYLTAAQFIILGLYALSFIVEMFINSYTKDELEVIDSFPTEESKEEERYINTKGYEDLVFSDAPAPDEPGKMHVEPSKELIDSQTKGAEDFIMGFDPDEDYKKNKKDKKHKDDLVKSDADSTGDYFDTSSGVDDFIMHFDPDEDYGPRPKKEETHEKTKETKKRGLFSKKHEEPKQEPEKPELEIVEDKPSAEPETGEPFTAKHFAPELRTEAEKKAVDPEQTSSIEKELKDLNNSKTDNIPEVKVPETLSDDVKPADNADKSAEEKARLSDIDKLLQELDNKSE